jgi:hypothetical protein
MASSGSIFPGQSPSKSNRKVISRGEQEQVSVRSGVDDGGPLTGAAVG